MYVPGEYLHVGLDFISASESFSEAALFSRQHVRSEPGLWGKYGKYGRKIPVLPGLN
jgi:hypothetical protein